MHPLILIGTGLGVALYGLKQLSGQNEKNSTESLTDSKKRAKVTTASPESGQPTETETETGQEPKANGDTIPTDIDSDNGDSAGNVAS